MSKVERAITIVPATIRHADDLARLHASLFPDAPWDAATFKEMLAHPGALGFVARAGRPREVVGFLVGRVAADEAELLTFCVAMDTYLPVYRITARGRFTFSGFNEPLSIEVPRPVLP